MLNIMLNIMLNFTILFLSWDNTWPILFNTSGSEMHEELQYVKFN